MSALHFTDRTRRNTADQATGAVVSVPVNIPTVTMRATDADMVFESGVGLADASTVLTGNGDDRSPTIPQGAWTQVWVGKDDTIAIKSGDAAQAVTFEIQPYQVKRAS